jgi:hypothetical protein
MRYDHRPQRNSNFSIAKSFLKPAHDCMEVDTQCSHTTRIVRIAQKMVATPPCGQCVADGTDFHLKRATSALRQHNGYPPLLISRDESSKLTYIENIECVGSVRSAFAFSSEQKHSRGCIFPLEFHVQTNRKCG